MHGGRPRFETAILCTRGGREYNQDHADFVLADEHGCWIVADGLGGHKGGEIASHEAVDALLEDFLAGPAISEEALQEYVLGANEAVLQAQRTDGPASMRTTIVVLTTDSRHARWAHVGDTRAYWFADGLVAAQTEDHSVPQMLVALGEIAPEEIRLHEDRSRLTRALGQEDPVEVAVSALAGIEADDAFLLCTDGWWEYVTETEMEIDLAKAVDPEHWLALMEERILLRATGEHDNYSASAVWVES